MNTPAPGPRRTLHNFLLFLAVFTALDLLSWPFLMSVHFWILGDRGSFLNLDYLISQHLRLGVDVFYVYGLLPVFIQHWLFVLFGRGYWPLIGCAVVTFTLLAWFWAVLLKYLPRESIWIIALVATSRMIHWVNPNFPYSLVQLSMLFALLFVLLGRMDISLALAAIGIWSVPSLPLALTGLLVCCIVLSWYLQPERSISQLLRSLIPGFAVYILIGVLLVLEFGWQSVLATATPLAGMKFYKAMHYGALNSAIVQFVHPPYKTGLSYLAYAFGTPVAWWVLSVLCLSVFGILSIRRMVLQKALNNKDLTIALCAIIHGIFVCFAYGATTQHYIFDPLLAAGLLLGLSTLPKGRLRLALLASYICLGVIGQANFARLTLVAWKDTHSPTATANLYAPAAWIAEWKDILDLSTHHNLFLLSFSTGVHNYFPTVHSADAWFLNPGELTVSDKNRLMEKLKTADVVALDLSSPTGFVDTDPDVQQYLKLLCLKQSTKYFQVWWRNPDNQQCLTEPHRIPMDSAF